MKLFLVGQGDIGKESAAAAALLGLALVLLDWCLVVTQTLEIGEDPGLGDLALETA